MGRLGFGIDGGTNRCLPLATPITGGGRRLGTVALRVVTHGPSRQSPLPRRAKPTGDGFWPSTGEDARRVIHMPNSALRRPVPLTSPPESRAPWGLAAAAPPAAIGSTKLLPARRHS